MFNHIKNNRKQSKDKFKSTIDKYLAAFEEKSLAVKIAIVNLLFLLWFNI